ncbi:hypothetical protein HEP73_04363 [Xanthomonas sp. GW]|uniref:hypothetical protein n=1 Tax=Xanthomonas sp. GW TaxID=2724121 RepID=UPI00163B44BA|nr:hypothetical protein [Xanthomonas sp. GW]QNH23410.1 hypothetical protein HEP73_04363 [Xanthomonas sp. GW]
MPSSKPPFFFQATQSVDNRLGDTFGFVWASYAGLRELWWQVRGFKSQFPSLKASEVRGKFLSGLPLPGGIDLDRIFLKTDWPEHEEEFAKWILFEACTLYESWAEKVCGDIFPASSADRNAKQLQFPSGVGKRGNRTGYIVTIQDANTPISHLMATEFLPTLKKSKLNRWAVIEEHLIAYRFFKECRNAFIHSDGFATQNVLDAQIRLLAVQGVAPNPFRHLFALPTLTLGKRIALNTRDCILFATLVRKLICTFDAALSVAKASEVLLQQRLELIKTGNTAWVNLPNDAVRREQRVHRMLAAARIPEPVNLPNVMAWMQAKKIIQ